MNPINKFQEYFQDHLKSSVLKIPTACTLSTIGLDGFPNARMVSLKNVTDQGFVITGPLDSRKGKEITISNKVALTFWWPETDLQIRIQGFATKISNILADKYFYERDRASQLISSISKQGDEMPVDSIEQKISEFEKSVKSHEIIARPANWGGYEVNPTRMEFMEFKDNRFHVRTMYEKAGKIWKVKQLQP